MSGTVAGWPLTHIRCGPCPLGLHPFVGPIPPCGIGLGRGKPRPYNRYDPKAPMCPSSGQHEPQTRTRRPRCEYRVANLAIPHRRRPRWPRKSLPAAFSSSRFQQKGRRFSEKGTSALQASEIHFRGCLRGLTDGGESRRVSACILWVFLSRPTVDRRLGRPRRMSSVSLSGDSTESDFKVSPLCQRKNSFWESTTVLNRAAWW